MLAIEYVSYDLTPEQVVELWDGYVAGCRRRAGGYAVARADLTGQNLRQARETISQTRLSAPITSSGCGGRRGFVCPHCASSGWRTARGDWSCAGCRRRVSVTAGTVIERTRTPLTTWFAADWYMTNQKIAGVSAKGLQRVLELGSYQTAWTMLHKYRSAMVRPGRELLTGTVEVDDTLVGGTRPGLAGRGAKGKTLVASL